MADELKQKGNKLIKEKQYEAALECYNAALKLKPEDHTVYSNRSLAYLRIGKAAEALSDAEECLRYSPQFARGYMRKAIALNVLKMHEKAKEAAVAGYLLRGSDTISKECISQWISACSELYKDYYLITSLPTGSVITSDKYFVTLMAILQSRMSSINGMTTDQMITLLEDVTAQLYYTLNLFGHSDKSKTVEEWRNALVNISDVDQVPKEACQVIADKSKLLCNWLNKDIDPHLYPIVRPILILAVMTVLSRCYILNCMNLGHINIQLLSQGCLPLFENSILNTPEYIGQYLGTIVGLLDSFIARGSHLTLEDLALMKRYADKTESLLPSYEATRAWEVEHVKDIAIRVVANVRGALKSKSTGLTVQSELLPQDALLSGEIAKRDALKWPIEIEKYLNDLLSEVKEKTADQYFLRDAENLMHGSGKVREGGRVCIRSKESYGI